MNSELDEQQKLVFELKDKLQTMETEEKDLTEKVRTLETKVVVKDLQAKVKVKSEAINQLHSKVEELEKKLNIETESPGEEEVQLAQPEEVAPRQKEEKARRFF